MATTAIEYKLGIKRLSPTPTAEGAAFIDSNFVATADAIESHAGDMDAHGLDAVRQSIATIQLTPGPPGDKGDKGDKGDAGDPATNRVNSVAGRIGDVVLAAADIAGLGSAATTNASAYDAAGAATAAQAYAIQRGNHTGTQPISTISDVTATGKAVSTAADAAAARTAIGAADAAKALDLTATTTQTLAGPLAGTTATFSGNVATAAEYRLPYAQPLRWSTTTDPNGVTGPYVKPSQTFELTVYQPDGRRADFACGKFSSNDAASFSGSNTFFSGRVRVGGAADDGSTALQVAGSATFSGQLNANNNISISSNWRLYANQFDSLGGNTGINLNGGRGFSSAGTSVFAGSGTMSHASGTGYALAARPVMATTGTAGFVVVHASPSGTHGGSGTLYNWLGTNTAGTTTSSIDTAGNQVLAGTLTAAGATFSGDVSTGTGGKLLLGDTNAFLQRQTVDGAVWLHAHLASGVRFVASGSERARFSPTNWNLLLGTTTDNGTDKLQVSGSATFSGPLTVNATAATVGTFNTTAASGQLVFATGGAAKFTIGWANTGASVTMGRDFTALRFAGGVGAGQTTELRGGASDAASAVGVIIDNAATLATAGAKLLSVRNNGTEKASIDYAGNTTQAGGATITGRVVCGNTLQLKRINTTTTPGTAVDQFAVDQNGVLIQWDGLYWNLYTLTQGGGE